MMRGAELLFAALFSITFLKRKLNKLHFGGIGFCITGLSLVGLSSAASGNGGAGNTVRFIYVEFYVFLVVFF